MSLATAAAYETLTPDFCIDTLQTHFLDGPKAELPLQLAVQRLSDGGRFATRVVIIEQSGIRMVHVTLSFVRASAMKGPSMTHSVRRRTTPTVEEITLDDLAPGINEHGPYMKFQRLALVYTGPEPKPAKPPPELLTYTSVATISPPMKNRTTKLGSIGVVAISDYHVLDGPPHLHGLRVGLPEIGDATRTPLTTEFERYTSLNHTIHFHTHEDLKPDDLCYIEVTSPWTNRRRAEVQTRIFDRSGRLLASCVQEAYYVLKEEKGDSKL